MKKIDAHQLLIDWSQKAALPGPATGGVTPPVPEPMVLRLKWDFCTSFPKPKDEAVDAGILQADDATVEGIRSIHEEHARELLAVLHDLSAVMDARRRGVDPLTGLAPRTQASKQHLAERFAKEPGQLQHRKEILLGSYADAFGDEAATEFEKAVDAWHAGIEVAGASKSAPLVPASIAAPPTPKSSVRTKSRARHVLPCPKPLPTAVKSGQFGYEENGKPVRPGAAEIRAIIRNQADKLIDLLGESRSAPHAAKGSLRNQFAAGVANVAEDFGIENALRLKTYVELEARTEFSCRSK